MNPKQSGLDDLLHAPQAASLLKNKQAMENLMKSGEAQRLMELLNKNAGSGLKDAAQSAMNGDTSQLMNLVQGLMKDPQSAKLVEELNKKVNQ
ncbi:MAG: hypothetical protein ACI3XJ_03110 [Oscillospiraceae bacterium]